MLKETSYIGVPVIALCSSTDSLRFVDCCIPCNNSSQISVGIIYFIIAREMKRMTNQIKRSDHWDDEFASFLPWKKKKNTKKPVNLQNSGYEQLFIEPKYTNNYQVNKFGTYQPVNVNLNVQPPVIVNVPQPIIIQNDESVEEFTTPNSEEEYSPTHKFETFFW